MDHQTQPTDDITTNTPHDTTTAGSDDVTRSAQDDVTTRASHDTTTGGSADVTTNTATQSHSATEETHEAQVIQGLQNLHLGTNLLLLGPTRFIFLIFYSKNLPTCSGNSFDDLISIRKDLTNKKAIIVFAFWTTSDLAYLG